MLRRLMSSLARATEASTERTEQRISTLERTLNPVEVDREINPFEVLLDLRLPGNLPRELAPVFAALGLELEDDLRTDTSGTGQQRRLHRLHTADDSSMYMMHIPRFILQRPGEISNLAALDHLRLSFMQNTRLYLVSEGTDYLVPELDDRLNAWRRRELYVTFIPWKNIEEMKEAFADHTIADRRRSFRATYFALEDPPLQAPVRITLNDIELDQEEYETLVRIMAGEAQHAPMILGPKGFFSNVLKESQLPQQWQDERIADLTGMPRSDAIRLVKWALHKQWNTTRTTYSVLAELITPMIENVGQPHKKFLIDLVVTKPLVTQAAIEEFTQLRIRQNNRLSP